MDSRELGATRTGTPPKLLTSATCAEKRLLVCLPTGAALLLLRGHIGQPGQSILSSAHYARRPGEPFPSAQTVTVGRIEDIM